MLRTPPTCPSGSLQLQRQSQDCALVHVIKNEPRLELPFLQSAVVAAPVASRFFETRETTPDERISAVFRVTYSVN